MDEIFLFLLLGLCLLALHYAFDRWNSRAPAPDGLYAGERLISSMRAKVSIDGAFLAGEGFAYLTDLRLVWTPSIGNLRNVMVRGLSRSSLYEEPVVVEFPAIRKVDARFHLGGSRLVVETVDARIDLLVYDAVSVRGSGTLWRTLGTSCLLISRCREHTTDIRAVSSSPPRNELQSSSLCSFSMWVLGSLTRSSTGRATSYLRPSSLV